MRVFNNVDIASSLRSVDNNGYLSVKTSPVLSAGVLEYLGSELIDGGSKNIDGLEIDPAKTYKIHIAPAELRKSKDKFKLLPLVEDHTWLGLEGENPKGLQEGSTGEDVYIEDDKLYVPLKFTNPDTVKKIMAGEKQELSASYENRLIRASQWDDYDFEAVDIVPNHIALVDKGRCGEDVRVLNSNINNNNKGASIMKAKNGLDGLKEYLKSKGFSAEDIETACGKISETKAENAEADEDKKEEKKPDEKKDEKKVENEDDKKEEKKEESEDKNKASNSAIDVTKIVNAAIALEREKNARTVRAYNAAKEVLGEFNFAEMDEKAILVKACNHCKLEVVDADSNDTLMAKLTTFNSVSKQMSNSFGSMSVAAAPSVEAKELEINI